MPGSTPRRLAPTASAALPRALVECLAELKGENLELKQGGQGLVE
ncbi:hypothetical protein [Hymenobacter properus]|nr:hypothetical protein [Hymenobacter properus]